MVSGFFVVAIGFAGWAGYFGLAVAILSYPCYTILQREGREYDSKLTMERMEIARVRYIAGVRERDAKKRED